MPAVSISLMPGTIYLTKTDRLTNDPRRHPISRRNAHVLMKPFHGSAGETAIGLGLRNVRYWPKADILIAWANVRFRG